jgi:excisionase family DNA binding protein
MPATATKSDLCLTRQEVMNILGVAERTVQVLAQNGHIEKLPAGPNDPPRYSESSVRRYLQAKQSGHLLPAAPRPPMPLLQAAAEPADEPQDSDTLSIHPWQYMTVSEAARFKRMPVPWIRQQIDSGRLPYEETGRGIRILRSDLEQLGSSLRKKGSRR